ncbi:hypothetical protein ACFLQW_03265 [Candidatus Zixiibacteriota bacterium]
MNETYAHLTGHRSWWILDFSVWGDTAAESVELLANEIAGSTRRVVFFQCAVGGAEQEVLFSELTDHRANALPATIERPLIVIIPKSQIGVALTGEPSSSAFKIARMQSTTENALVDLWVVEMGN